MHILFLALLIPLSACAAGNDWPSLARRPGETAPLPTVAAPVTPLVASATSSTPTVIVGRIAEATRDFAAISKRWQGQRATTAAAVSATRGATENSEVGVKAQLEITRFERIGAQVSDLRVRLDAISGDLAVAAAEGGEPGQALRELGGLIGKVEALRTEHLAAFSLLRNK